MWYILYSLTSGPLEEYGHEGAEVTFLVGEGVVEGGKTAAGEVLHGAYVLYVSWILTLAGHPHHVGFRFAGLEKSDS